jgi:hypothetical protein
MATLYAINAGGNWSASATWSTTATKSAARTGGAGTPTAADDCIIDDYSGAVTIDSGSTRLCRSLNANGRTATLTHNAATDLSIGDGTAGAGNVALDLGTGTYTINNATTSSITFLSTSATVQTVNFRNLTTGNVTFNASSNGSWQYTGAHNTGATSTVTLTKGTLDINGQTCSWGAFNSNNSNTRSLILGAANITMTGSSGNIWSVQTTTGLTLSATSSTLNFTGASAIMAGGGNLGSITATGSGEFKVSVTISCTNFTRTGTVAKTDSFSLDTGVNLTCSGSFTCNGNSTIDRIFTSSKTIGTARTITADTWSVTNTDFQDITGAGAGSRDFSAQTDVGDCGGNTGITFPASVQQTCTMSTNHNWSDSIWTTRVPLPQDDVVMTGVTGGTLTADMPRLGRSIDWTGASGSPTWSFASVANSVFGSITLISGMTVSGTNTMTLAGRGNFSLTSSGITYTQGISITAPTGTYTMQDALNSAGGWTLNNGIFNSNGFTHTATTFTSNNSNVRGITKGSSNWITTSTAVATIINFAVSTNMTYSGANGTFTITGATSNTRTISGGSLTYGTLTYTIAGSTGELDITNSNSFAAINFSDASNARSLKFTKATTTTIRNGNGFNVRGTSGKLITLDTVDGAGVFTLTSTNQQGSMDYITPTRSTVDATPKWYAGANSTDGGTTTNWVFTDAPVLVNGSGSGGLKARMNLQNLQRL